MLDLLNFAKYCKFSKFMQISSNFGNIKHFSKFQKNVILELCKGVHCVDLGESFQTHIYLQNLASIQPRTSPLKFVGSPLLPGPSRQLREKGGPRTERLRGRRPRMLPCLVATAAATGGVAFPPAGGGVTFPLHRSYHIISSFW